MHLRSGPILESMSAYVPPSPSHAPSGPATTSTGSGLAAAVLLGLALLVVFFIPLTLATIGWTVLHRRLHRLEGVVLGASGIVGLTFGPKRFAVEYGKWLWALASGHGDRLAVPWLVLGLLGLVFLGGSLLVRRSVFARALGGHMSIRRERWRGRVQRLLHPTRVEGESLAPTEQDRLRLEQALPGSPHLMVAAAAHAVTGTPTGRGKRVFPLGIDRVGVPVGLSEDELRMHMLVFGSTGAGKTVTLETLAGGLLDLGWSGCVLDHKEDTQKGGLRDWLHDYANSHALPYQELKLSDKAPNMWFNPLYDIDLDEMRDMILSAQTFEAPHWKALCEVLLGQLLRLFIEANEIDPLSFPLPTIMDIGRVLTAAGGLKNATKKMVATVLRTSGAERKADFSSLTDPTADQTQAAVGLGARLTAVFESEAGRTILQGGDGRRVMDITQSGITYIGLDAQGKIDLSKLLSASVLRRFSVYSAQVATGRRSNGERKEQRFLMIDEANVVDTTILHNLLGRCRSAGIAVILATQGPLDWIDPDGGDMFAKLVQNTNVLIAMNQGEAQAAEKLSEHFGSQISYEVGRSVTGGVLGETTAVGRPVESRLVKPDDLRSMRIGEAFIRVNKPDTKVTWCKVPIRDPKARAQR